jgi:hypothetical protein
MATKSNPTTTLTRGMREAHRPARVAAGGRVAVTHRMPNKRAVNNKRAARGRVAY